MRIETQDFNLTATLESGQVFGFTNIGEDRYQGLLFDTEVVLEESSNYLCIVSLEISRAAGSP
jgi:hypothetical protein